MANWKLRKDKTPSEAPGAEAEAVPIEQGESEQRETEQRESNSQESSQYAEPSLLAAGSEARFTDLEFDNDDEPQAGQIDHGDGPLTLVDYTEPGEYSPLESAAHGAEMFDAPASVFEMSSPAFALPPAIEALPPAFEAEPVSATFPSTPGVIPTLEDDFQQRLRTGRFEAGELASPPQGGFTSTGIPTVSPFVLDAPPAALAPAPPQLVVHVGRLSAPFGLTKDVTTIGRPDSALHYYPDVEIELDDAVSRRHAEVVNRGGEYYLVDTGSTNGTRLNGAMLPAHEEHLLAHGDRIRVGEITEIVFE